jgi:metallophosphoesterase (TIGR00282 family)
MKILVFGDIVGRIGRRALAGVLPDLKTEHAPDLVIANVENAAHGRGISLKSLREIKEAGVDFMTTGNHIWDNKEAWDCFADPELSGMLIRPANWPEGVPGKGAKMLTVGTKNVLVLNFLGRVHSKYLVNDPFRAFDDLLKSQVSPKPDIVLVDFHAEVTAEKNAFGLYADGRATAVWGTHTHVQTNDARILPAGTAYITDLGMCGFRNGVIGSSPESALPVYTRGMPIRMEVPERGEALVNAILIETDSSGQAQGITPLVKSISI